MKITSHLLLAAATLVAASSVNAATQTWHDANANNTWNTTNLNWDGGAATWTNGNDAIFGGTGEAITIGAGTQAHNLTFNSTGYSVATNILTLTGTTPTIEVTNLADSATISSILAGTAGLTKTGAGTLNLTGNNTTLTGDLNVGAGILTYNGAGKLIANAPAGGGALAIASGAKLTLNSTVNNVLDAYGAWTIAGTLESTNTGLQSIRASSITLNNGTINSTGGVAGVGGWLSYQALTITANGADNFINSSGNGGLALQRANGSVLTLATALTSDRLTISSTINPRTAESGANGALVKTGAGTVILSGTNTYNGTTTISGGTLLANNSSGSATGTGAVSVASGARLGGTGKVTGAVTVNGTLRGGDGSTASGALTLGNVTLASGSVIELALGSDGTHSSLIFNGTESFQSNQTFSFLDLGAEAGGNYIGIITGVTVNPNTTGTWLIANDGWLGTFSWNAGTNAIDLNLAAVPEPSTYGLIGAGALAAVAMVRRRRKHAGKVA